MYPEGSLPHCLSLQDRWRCRALVILASVFWSVQIASLPLARAAKPVAEVVEGEPAVFGEASVKGLRKRIKKALKGVKGCYAEMLVESPAWAGVGVVLVRLDADGAVLAAKMIGPVAEGLGKNLRRCVQDAVASWAFPGADRAGVRFKIPLTFGGKDLKKGRVRSLALARFVSDALPPLGMLELPDSDGTSEPTGDPPLLKDPGTEEGGGAEWSFAPEEMSGAPATKRKTSVKVANIRAGSGMDLAGATDMIEKHLDELESCWQLAADGDPSLTGGRHILSIHVAAEDGPSGRKKIGAVYSVASVTRDIGDAAVLCIEGVVGSLVFPAPSVAKAVVTGIFELKAK